MNVMSFGSSQELTCTRNVAQIIHDQFSIVEGEMPVAINELRVVNYQLPIPIGDFAFAAVRVASSCDHLVPVESVYTVFLVVAS